MSAKEFAVLVADKTFTNGSDRDFVKRKYAETFEAVMGAAEVLRFDDLDWDDDDIERLATVLSYCRCVQVLNLARNRIGDRGAAVLAVAVSACPFLGVLNVSYNPISEEGMNRLVSAAKAHPSIQAVQKSHEQSRGKCHTFTSDADLCVNQYDLRVMLRWRMSDATALACVSELCQDFLEVAKTSTGVQFYNFSVSGNELDCKAGFDCASSYRAHQLKETLLNIENAELTAIEVHGPKEEVDQLRGLFYGRGVHAQFWPYMSLGYFVPQWYMSEEIEEIQAISDSTVRVFAYYQISGTDKFDEFLAWLQKATKLTRMERSVKFYGAAFRRSVAVTLAGFPNAEAFQQHVVLMDELLTEARSASKITRLEISGPQGELDKLRSLDSFVQLPEMEVARFWTNLDGAFFFALPSNR